MQAEHAREYRPGLAAVYVAGSLGIDAVKASLNKVFGSWQQDGGKGSGELQDSKHPASAEGGLRIFLVDKPGAVQTAIRFLMPAPPYASPDRLRLEELGTLLGGSFTSRLNQNLREDKGYTYGAFAGYSMERNVGSFYAAASVRADVTGASLIEFFKEFNRIRAGDVSQQEVAKATAYIRTQGVTSLSTLGGLLADATGLAAVGRPISALNEDERSLEAIQAIQLNQLAKSAVPFEKGVLILVGDKKLILRQLSGMNLPQPKEVAAN